MRWREEPEPGPLRTAWEGLRAALAELRGELGHAWGYRRQPTSRTTSPLLAEPRLRAPWSADVLAPPVGAMCSRCGSAQWWSERPPERVQGWRCARCHPAPVEAGDVVRVAPRSAAGI